MSTSEHTGSPASTSEYVTQSEFEDFIKRTLSTEEADIYSIMESSIASVIDNYCDTTFANVTSSADRYYDGNGECEIDIRPATTVSAIASLSIDDSIVTTLDSDYYSLEPINSNVKTSVRLKTSRFPIGANNIKVTGIFTSYDSKIPEEVKLVSMKLMEQAYRTEKFNKESIEGYSYELKAGKSDSKILNSLLGKYRRVLL